MTAFMRSMMTLRLLFALASMNRGTTSGERQASVVRIKAPSPVLWRALGLVRKLLRSVGGGLDAVHGFQKCGSDDERLIQKIAIDDQRVRSLTASDGVGGTLAVDAIVAVLAEQ